ncbi:PPOX class F420-dependent oxidoreductase [Cellulomonas sp. PhB143]|uniref:PPOX class F420-dependent oxidoreductase n=1 Tax=Cellulomonas sp. PhB143 TaxID=2485186 RepID=UPI0013157EE9|nr:PPOX class F420-dependent oxidoreductase [Cellulomonas sp. PhB143]
MATSNQDVALGDEQFVALTTYKRSGDGVTTPVWVAPAPRDPGTLYVVTGAATGKAKRLRNGSRVRIQPCGRTGTLRGVPVEGSGRIVADATERSVAEAALRGKYGFQYRLSGLATRLRRKGGGQVFLALVPGERAADGGAPDAEARDAATGSGEQA